MTREEALEMVDSLVSHPPQERETMTVIASALRTYILNSIPTPTVEVVEVETSDVGRFYRIMVNGKQVYFHGDKAFAEMFANDLRAALGIEVKP